MRLDVLPIWHYSAALMYYTLTSQQSNNILCNVNTHQATMQCDVFFIYHLLLNDDKENTGWLIPDYILNL